MSKDKDENLLDDLLASVIGEERTQSRRSPSTPLQGDTEGAQEVFIPVEDREKRPFLYELPLNTLFIAEGTFAASYDMRKEHVMRMTLTDVVFFPYDTATRFEALPALGVIQEVNVVRKRDNTQFLKEGERIRFICKVEPYRSISGSGAGRRGLKLFVDTPVEKQVLDIERRVRSINTLWETLSEDDLTTRMGSIKKAMGRLTSVSVEYMFIPTITKGELEGRLEAAKRELKSIQNRPQAGSVRGSEE